VSIVVVGTSHRRASLDLRERLRLDAPAADELAGSLRAAGLNAVVLSTCNRTELYVTGGNAADAVLRAENALVQLGGSPVRSTLFRRRDGQAAHHLFAVAAGLHSLVPGESQILGQVREAARQARTAGTAGPLLGRLFDQAVRTGKRVRSETALGRNVSIPSVALELAERDLDSLEGRNVLVIGTGAMAELMLQKLLFRRVGGIVVAGRTPAKVRRLAARFGARAVGLDAIGRELQHADLVVTATSAPGFVVRVEDLAGRERPLVLVDLAVPRDVDPAVARLRGCRLHDVDDLTPIVRRGDAAQRVDIERARGIVAEEVRSFCDWRNSLQVAPAIASLHRRAEEIRAAELVRAHAKLATLSAEQQKAVEAVTTQIVGKLLHTPTARLKQADGLAYAAALEHLFDLGEAA
jgi:glutamyl-tRNA reductase